jgi:uncharacterized protein
MFLDTSGLLSLFDSRDVCHEDAVREFRRADRFLTNNYVLAEFAALANARNLPRHAAIGYIQDLLNDPMIEVLWIDEAFTAPAWTCCRGVSTKTIRCATPSVFFKWRREALQRH